MTTDPIVVFASFHPVPGKADELQDLLSWMVENTRTEPGCERYELYRQDATDEVFHLFERYQDQEALQAHRAAGYYVDYRRRVSELIEGTVEVVLLQPVDVGG
jgi:quinol monooxygenase YgiN